MTSLGKARDDFAGDVGSKVDAEREVHVMGTDDIAKFFTAFKLKPMLDETKRG